MRWMPKFFKLSFSIVVVFVIALMGWGGRVDSTAAQDATAAATEAAAPAITMCVAPPTPTPAAPEPTSAPTTAPATAEAAQPTTQPTVAPPTAVPPTATPIPQGKKPATAGLVLTIASKMTRKEGYKCPVVASLTAGGPADVAGIQTGDYVLGFGNDELKDAADFFSHVGDHASGDEVTVIIQRGDQLMTVKVVLGLNQFAQ